MQRLAIIVALCAPTAAFGAVDLIQITGTASGAGTITLADELMGDLPGETAWVPFVVANVDAGMTALDVRDQIVPEVGARRDNAGGPAGAQRVRLSGAPGILIESPGGGIVGLLNYWVQQDGGPYEFLEPGVPVTVNGLTFTLLAPSVPGVAGGTVPAVSTWGLIVMALVLAAAGSVLFARRVAATT